MPFSKPRLPATDEDLKRKEDFDDSTMVKYFFSQRTALIREDK
jgi:hypothetical protein